MSELLSTHQVAKKLGIGMATLTRYIQAGKIPAPETKRVGGMRIRLWSEKDIERVRALLPKIANGRKTRYQKKRQSALSNQQSSESKPSPKDQQRKKQTTRKPK